MIRRAGRCLKAAALPAVLVLSLLISGCPGDQASKPEAEPATPPKSAAPAHSGLAAAVRTLETAIPGLMQDWHVPGLAVAVVYRNETLYSKGFGVKKAGTNDPVNESTMFQIGSCSKAFTATLAASFADQGAFAFTDPVVERLPGFRLSDPWVTGNFMVMDLMAQRSGMPANALDSLALLGYPTPRILDSLRFVRPETSFRSSYAYQNSLFLAVAALIERYGGATYESLLLERILDTLDMTATNTRVQAMAQSPNAATGHARIDNATVPLDWGAPYQRAIDALCPAGGISSNVQDMAKWLVFNLNNGVGPNGRLVSNASMDFIHSPRIDIPTAPGGHRLYYCQGWVYQEDAPSPVIWHTGGTFGMGALVAFSPGEDVGLVMLSNLPGPHTHAMLEIFFGALHGRDVKSVSSDMLEAMTLRQEQDQPLPAPESPSPALAADAYVGRYANDLYGPVSVAQSADGLILSIGPRNATVALTHLDRDAFSATPPWPEDDASLVRFAIGPDGRAQSLNVGFLEEFGFSTFERTPPNQ